LIIHLNIFPSQGQFKVTGWGNIFICDMVLRCAGDLKPSLIESRPITAYLTTHVVHSYKLLIHDVKPVHSLTHGRKLWALKYKMKLIF